MKKRDSIILRDMSKDYPEAKAYIEDMYREHSISKTMISETLIVFEALCYKIFEESERPKGDVMVSGFQRLGDTALEISFMGNRFDPDPVDPTFNTPEDSVLAAYADKIDYSYRSGRNRITITTKRNHMMSVWLYAASIILGILIYTVLHFFAPVNVQYFVAAKMAYPLERLFLNSVVMVGGPVTFLSLLKHLTDTYIIAENQSSARRLHRNTITSSLVSVFLSVVSSWLIASLLFPDDPMHGKYTHRVIDLDPENLIPSLMPSDIFAPFQTLMPYSLIILAIMITYAFCSVGKYFDRMKDAIDVAYVLFARMLALVMYALPFFATTAVLDELFSDGYQMIRYITELVVVAFASLGVLLGYYVIRLLARGIHPVAFFKKMLPLLYENASIASAFDAVPYNIRYCARTYGFDRKRLEHYMPVLAQINLDGNCFLITMIAMLYIAINSTPLSIGDTISVGILVLLLSLGAPNQPGSCLVGLTIVMVFIGAEELCTIAIIGELFFGGILNLTNIAGDIVTVAIEEAGEGEGADKINEAIS